MTLRLLTGTLLCAAFLSANAQTARKDKAAFVPYQNDFFKEIESSLDGTAKTASPEDRFQMQYGDIELPERVDQFKTAWCNAPISQGRTGTCWCFSSSSFFESEIHRLSGKQIKLSELYIVYWEYVAKAREYITTRGTSFFGEGSETNAVTRMMKEHGAMPAAAYSGIRNGRPFHDHQAMYQEMKQFLESLKRDNNWNEAAGVTTIRAILDHYIGAPPEQFVYEDKTYTPQTFLSDVTGLNPDHYVNFMSLMEVPYYEKAVYNVPDNWWNSNDYYNVPLDDFMGVIAYAANNGYTLALGGDVSESGYGPREDVAMVPTYDVPPDYIDQYSRQLRFSNGSTTDDHAIHLVGATENSSGRWYLIKDSGSGSRNGQNIGYYFYHEDYIKLKMMSFTIHRDAAREVLKLVKR